MAGQVAPNILIVEDEFLIRDALTEFLEEEGYRVVGAANGQEALNMLRKGLVPDLILLDLMMPVMSGMQFLDEQQADSRLASIPVVLLSADRNSQEKVLSSAPVEYLEKPVRLTDLLDTVERYCQ
ncbi:MAG: response regulator [Chloroflexi bacterium]|nr:response regulator [Chloroflexota bacterium]